MKILGFAGSNSSKSINKKLVRYVISYFEAHSIKILDISEYEMPIFSVDREEDTGYPDEAYAFITEMKNCDCIIFSLAEHNRSYTAAFKNVLDWCSRIDINVFQQKPMLLMSTSPGGYGGGNVMNAAKAFFPKCGAEIVATFSLPSFHQSFNEGEGIINKELRNELEENIKVLKARLGL